MKRSMRKIIISAFVAIAMIVSMLPAMAASGKIEIVFTDCTASDPTTLTGEAKIMVSVKADLDDVSIAQMALEFEGDVKYKSVTFLKGENNPPECFLYSPNAAEANSTGELMPSIISTVPMTFDDQTDLFILTFESETPGAKVKLSIRDLEDTYCVAGGKDYKPTKKVTKEARTSEKANSGKEATVVVEMDKITDFVRGVEEEGYMGSGVELKITSETTENYVIYTVLNNILVSRGGHRENKNLPTFTVTNTVLADETYTVELSGLGYVTYIAEGVDFEEPLVITNDDFVPGDVDGDGEVTIEDKNLFTEAMENEEIAAGLMGAADFNRDGFVDRYDEVAFDGLEDNEDDNDDEDDDGEDTPKASAPSKMEDPEVKADGSSKIKVEWKAPENNGSAITGYIIKYGKDKDKLNKTEKEARRKAFAENGFLSSAIRVIEVSAQNGEGIEELKSVIEDALEEDFLEKYMPVSAEAEKPQPVKVAVVKRKK